MTIHLIFQKREQSIDLPEGATLQDLYRRSPYKGCNVILNGRFTFDDPENVTLHEGDRVKIHSYVNQYKMPLAFLLHIPKAEMDSLYENSMMQTISLYDAEHCTEYVTTLRSYLLHNMNTSLVAEDIHVHRNTVIYRINRIVELFGIDLKDCRIIASLYLSLFKDIHVKSTT